MEELLLLNLIYVIDIVKSVKNMVIRMIINYAFPVYKIIDILMIRNLIQIVFPMDIFMMIVQVHYHNVLRKIPNFTLI